MTVFIQVDGRQEAGQAGGGGPGRRARQRRARQEEGQAGVTVFIQVSMPGGRRARREAAGQAELDRRRARQE